MDNNEQWIAVCGLDCTDCPLCWADRDVEAAQRLVAWFRDEGWLDEDEGAAEVMQRGPYCRGCRGDRAAHWSPDCWILHCRDDEKGLNFCSACDAFPCDRLRTWTQQNPRYTKALGRLQRMAEDSPTQSSPGQG